MARNSNQSYFGIRIFEIEKFIMSILGLLGFVIMVTFFVAKFYVKQDFLDEQHRKERECDNSKAALQSKIDAFESSKNVVTKDELKEFEENVMRSINSKKD